MLKCKKRQIWQGRQSEVDVRGGGANVAVEAISVKHCVNIRNARVARAKFAIKCRPFIKCAQSSPKTR